MSKFKRGLSIALMLIMCTALLAGCSTTESGQGDTTSNSPVPREVPQPSENTAQSAYVYQKTDSVVEITLWTSAMESINQELVDLFNATKGAELNIYVNADYQGDYLEMQKKINASSIAKTLPNAFICEVAMTRGFAEDGVIVNLEPYIVANGFNSSEFQIGDLRNLYLNGDMYAFPHMRSLPVMYVNQTLAREVGLSENGPATFDELEAYLKACYDHTGQPAMYLYNLDFWTMEALLYSYSNATTTLNADETSCNINSEGGIALITFLRGLVDKGYIMPLAMTDMNGFFGTFTNPNTALWFTSIGAYKMLYSMTEFDLGVSMMPAGAGGTRGVPVGGSNTYLCDTGTDQQKAAAFEFMMWFSDTEQAAYASANTGYLPTKLASMDTEIMKETIAMFPGYSVAVEQLQYCIMRPTSGVYHEVQDVLCDKLYSLLTADNPDIRQSLDSLADEVNRILNR